MRRGGRVLLDGVGRVVMRRKWKRREEGEEKRKSIESNHSLAVGRWDSELEGKGIADEVRNMVVPFMSFVKRRAVASSFN